MNILLIDAYSAQHIGNLSLVDSSLQQLRGVFGEAEFTILAFDPVSIEKYSGCKTLATLWAGQFSGFTRLKKLVWMIRESLWISVNIFNFSLLKPLGLMINPEKYTFSKTKLSAIRAYNKAEIVVSISGEALQDSQWKRMPLFLFGYWLAHKMGKTMVIFPQSIGPLNKPLTRFMARHVLNLCDLVMPRDMLSLRVVQKLGIKPEKIYLVPDVAVNQAQVSSEESKKRLLSEGVNFNQRPLVGLTISQWKGVDYQSYFLTMKELCHFITDELKGAVVFFLANRPFQKDPGDWELTRQLYEVLGRHDHAVMLLKDYNSREFKGMLGELDLFISTRMHVSILATMAGTPTITVNTQPKLQGYMDLIHQGNRACNVKEFTIKQAKELVVDALKNSQSIRLSLRAVGIEVGKRSKIASLMVKQVYEQKIKRISKYAA
jgi:polysaccharide pyruvyl transferase WcaK-like protein